MFDYTDSYDTVEHHGMSAAMHAELEQADLSDRFASLFDNKSLEERLRAAIAAQYSYPLSVYTPPAALPALWVPTVDSSATPEDDDSEEADDTEDGDPLDRLDMAEHILSQYVSTKRMGGELILTSACGEAVLTLDDMADIRRAVAHVVRPLHIVKHTDAILTDILSLI